MTTFSQYQVVLPPEPTSFWRGKRDSRYHSTSSFSENVVVAKTGYQMLELLSFSDIYGVGLTFLLIFGVNTMKLSGVSYF